MAIVSMANAVAGNIAIAAEYNKLITNILDLDSRTQTLEGGTSSMLGRKASVQSTTAVNGITSTETIIQTLTFTAQTGRRYRITMDCQLVFSDSSQFSMSGYWVAAGSMPTPAGSQFYRRMTAGASAGNYSGPRTFVGEITGATPGTITVGFALARQSGSGSVDARADAGDKRMMYIDDIGT